ncbi:MAG: DUF421 domain-containing protein [Oscillospiraceae bacterium]|nr:DUF421 domain-containing protein [Oscillospiraceae bacterium]
MAIVFLRTLIVYISLLITLRLMGKRQLGEMELSEFVVAALIADLAAHPLQDIGIPMINGLIPIITLFCCELLISGLTMKNLRLRTLFFGEPSLLIENGQIKQREMQKNRFTLDELLEEMRAQGATDLAKVHTAILETDGRLNIVLKSTELPVTAGMLNLAVPQSSPPEVLVNDGRIIEDGLRRCGLNLPWLETKLKELGVQSASELFVLTVNSKNEIYYAKKEAKL